jgi:hypothetical protein
LWATNVGSSWTNAYTYNEWYNLDAAAEISIAGVILESVYSSAFAESWVGNMQKVKIKYSSNGSSWTSVDNDKIFTTRL